MNILYLLNVLNSIKTGYKRKVAMITVPYKLDAVLMLSALCFNGYISGYSIVNGSSRVSIFLRYHSSGQPAVTGLRFVTTPKRLAFLSNCSQFIRCSNCASSGIGLSALIAVRRQFRCVPVDSLEFFKFGFLVAFIF